MTRRHVPGARLHRFLRRCLNEDTFAHHIEPVIADLQYEAETATDEPTRTRAVIRGYAAIARTLAYSVAAEPRIWLASAIVVTLGIASALCWNQLRLSGSDARIGNSALLLPTFAAPLGACLLEGRRSYLRLFAWSAAAGAATWIAFDLLVSTLGPSPLVWHVVRLANGAMDTALVGALGAGLVWNPFDRRAPLWRRVPTGLVHSSLITAALFAIGSHGLTADALRFALVRGTFFVLLFALMLAVTIMPPLLVARRWLRRRVPLLLIAVCATPVLLLAAAAIDGHPTPHAIVDCLPWTRAGVAAALPFVAGSTALAVILGTHHTETEVMP